jgi:cytochrome c1
MPTRSLRAAIGLLMTCLPLAALGQAAPDEEGPRSGQALAIKICAACHVVSADQPSAPILRRPAPKFQAIADRTATSPEALRKFLSTTHRTMSEPFNMPNPELTDEMTTRIIDYIMSLRRKKQN